MANEGEAPVGAVTPEQSRSRFRELLSRFKRKAGATAAITLPTPEVQPTRITLSPEQFKLNQEVDTATKATIINPEAIKRGKPECYLVDPQSEAVVSYQGSAETLVELIHQAQQQPLVESTIKRDPVRVAGYGEIALQKTGIHIIKPFERKPRGTLLQPESTEGIDYRWEVVGAVRRADGSLQLAFLQPDFQTEHLHTPGTFSAQLKPTRQLGYNGFYPEDPQIEKDFNQLHLQKMHGQVGKLDYILRNPTISPSLHDRIERNLAEGMIMNVYGEQKNLGWIDVLSMEGRKPTPDQSITKMSLAFKALYPEEVVPYFDKVVVPQTAASGLHAYTPGVSKELPG